MHLKLFAKFVIILTLLAVIPAAVVGFRTIELNKAGMQAAILELHTHIASYLADDVRTSLKALEREIQYILRTLSAQMTWSDRQAVLQALLDTNENFVSVSIVNKDGRELLKAYNPLLDRDPRLISHSADGTFRRFWQNTKEAALSSVYFNGTEPRIDIVFPLGGSHCLFTTVTLKSLWDEITATRIASTGYAFLVDEKGTIIAHPEADLAIRKTSARNLPVVGQVLKAVTAGSAEYVHPLTHKKIVGAYAPVKGLNWGVIIQQDKAEAYVSVYRMQRQAAVLILISIVAAALVSLVVARSLTRPLLTLTEAARRIARKDFSPRVEVQTRDELQDLAETFNEMTTALQRYDKMQVDKIVEEKTKTEAVIFSIADGIIMTDGGGRLQVVNRHAREILGIPESGWQNLPLKDFVKNPALSDALTEVLGEDRANAVKEVKLSDEEPVCYYVLKSEEVVSPQSNEKIGLVTVLRNVTLEKELDNMKDEFLHSITHDLRNPMTSIRGFLKFLVDGVAGPTTPQQKKMLETIDRASLRLLGLINDILDIAKLEAGQLSINRSETDLKAIAQRCIEIAEGAALKKAISLSIEAPETLPKIACDAELVERVFTNLIGNALKFTPEQGKVSVRFEDRGDRFEVSVTDTGEGIPPDYRDKIFDKFQQVAGQHKGGTGLGLTICKHIIDAHGGKIWVESKLHEGSRFIFMLPKSPGPVAPRTEVTS